MTLPSLLSRLRGLGPLCPLTRPLCVGASTDWGGHGRHHGPLVLWLITGLLPTVGLGQAMLATPLMMRIIVSALLPLHCLVLPCIPLDRGRVSITSYRSRHITLSTFSFTTFALGICVAVFSFLGSKSSLSSFLRFFFFLFLDNLSISQLLTRTIQTLLSGRDGTRFSLSTGVDGDNWDAGLADHGLHLPVHK